MALRNTIARSSARFYCALTGDKMMSHFDTLQRNQWLPRAELDELTNRELCRLMEHAAANVPYYKRVFEERGLRPSDIQCTADLEKLPILTKRMVRENYDQLICPDTRDKLELRATGGSTGTPMHFALLPVVKQWGRAATLRAWGWAGYRLGDKQLLLWGSSFDLQRLHGLTSKIQRLVNRVCLLDGHVMSEQSCGGYVARIRRFRPKVFLAYANSLYMLAGYLNRNNIHDIHPHAIVSAAETLTPMMRAAIEKAFQCKVHDAYGSRETSLYAAQCGCTNLYHISSDTTVMEIVKDGRSAETGELGKITLTDLRNYGMPLIRYEIEDVAVAGDEPCPCGRQLPTFRSVEGRVSNIVSLPDGRHIHPLYMMYLMYASPDGDVESEENGMTHYRIIQETPTDFVVRIVRKPGIDIDHSYIITNFKKFLGDNIHVQLDYVDDMPVGASGKRQYIVSKVPLSL